MMFETLMIYIHDFIRCMLSGDYNIRREGESGKSLSSAEPTKYQDFQIYYGLT